MPNPRRLPADEGITLVEAVITIVLMAIVILPIFAAVTTSLSASGRQRQSAKVETVSRAVAEAISASEWKPCQGKDGFEPIVDDAAEATGWPGTVTVVEVTYRTATDSWSTRCSQSLASTHTLALQKVKVSITSSSYGVKRTVEVVKGDS